MELPFSLSSSSASAASSSTNSISTRTTTEMDMSTANALLKASEEQSARSYTNFITSDASNQHQLYQCQLQAYDEQVRSKKRKLASSKSIQEEAHFSSVHRLYSPLHKVDDQYCHGVSTIKDDQTFDEEERNQELELVGCTTPPYVLQSTHYAAHDHGCCVIREAIDHNGDPIDADLAEPHAPHSNTSVGTNQVSYKGEILLHNGDGIESMCGCSIRRGPPPPPRKPKAKPRILKSDHLLNFFVPPDLELFFSSTSPPPATDIHKQANHDTQQ